MAVLEGKAYWAYITEPNVRFEPMYTLTLKVDPNIAQKFRERGFSIKEIDNCPALFIKRRVNRQGITQKAPKLYNSDMEELKIKIKNGTNVKVEFAEWEVSNQFGEFKGLELRAVQITEPILESKKDGQELLVG